MQLQGKIVWVTGGRSGIGKAIASAFVREGARVFVSARASDELTTAAAELGPEATPIPCDVTDGKEVEEAARVIARTAGPVDVLVNNAGASVFKSFMDTTPADFDLLTTTNLRGPFLCTHAVLPDMLERKEGTVVMINSMAARQVFPDSSIYAASKGGLKMMTDCLRSEVRKSGVRIISVYPGATRTEIWPERVLEKHGHKMMGPKDVAQAVINACTAEPHVLIEDIVMQPIGGGI